MLRAEYLHIKIHFLCDGASLLDPSLDPFNIVDSLHELVAQLENLQEVLLSTLQDSCPSMNSFLIHDKVVSNCEILVFKGF